MRARSIAIWSAVAVIGAVAWGVIALVRDEQISAAWLIAAGAGSHALPPPLHARLPPPSRFSPPFLQSRAPGADPKRATPAERLDDDRDFQPTDRRVLFGHHFA